MKQTPEELRKDATAFRAKGKTERERDYWAINASRLEEMAFLDEKGYNLGTFHDLQVITLGDTEFFFIPGEYYVEYGIKLLEEAASKYPFAVTVANGNGMYFFSEKSALRYPTAFTPAEKLFGYYEIYGYMHKLRFKFQNNIADFILEKIHKLEKEI